jgi:pimeloyl-ACP methyl ester carboxylesterase
MPMLLIWGCQDRMIPPGIADTLVELNPHLKLVNLEAAGHCAHHEQPEEVNRLMRDWLDALNHTKLNHHLPWHSSMPVQFHG